MSTTRISAAEAARSFEALLDRVGDQRDEIEIEADGVVFARIVPATARRDGTLQALFGALGARPRRDAGFADDLEAIQGEAFGAADPWAN
jgi:antitoxin (DNA-binding transcriptional repressor) of toxin-antitoxin stability system